MMFLIISFLNLTTTIGKGGFSGACAPGNADDDWFHDILLPAEDIYLIILFITYEAIRRPAADGTKEIEAGVLVPVFFGISVE